MESNKQDPVVIDVQSSYLARSGSALSWGHPLVWLGITLALLVIGYVWLTVYAGATTDNRTGTAVKKLAPAEATKNLVVNPVVKEPEMPITQDSDRLRAEEYLEYEAVQDRILPLLDAADVHFENENYVTPPGDNAWESYQAILEIDPAESIAISGLTKIKSKLVGNAEQAIDNGEYADAESWLVQLDLIQPDESLQNDLRTEIKQLIADEAEARLQQQEADELRQKVTISLSQARLESEKETPNYNKLSDLYSRVLELDPENEEAITGLSYIADSKLDEVEKLLRQGNLDLASATLDEATRINPENRRISGLELALEASARQRQIEQEEKLEESAAQAEKTRVNNSAGEKLTSRAAEQTTGRATEAAIADISTAVTNALQGQRDTGVLAAGETQKAEIVSGIIGLNKEAQPVEIKRNPSLEQGVKAYYNGSYARSFELLYPLAQEGVTRAQFRIGIMYQFGRSVAKNTDLAEKWFTAALPELLREAQKGTAWAQTDLGTAYEFGISLQQDYERAAYWYQQAANQGYPGAQTNLGVLYAQGDGVPYDRSKAIEWLRKAALQGDRVANENLGILGVKL